MRQAPAWLRKTGVCIVLGSAANGPSAAPVGSASFGLSSDYVHRGLSQTAGGASVQIGGQLREPRFGAYGGALVSRIDPAGPPGAPEAELYLFGGVSGRWASAFNWDLSVARYAYPGDERELSYDYTELAAAFAYTDRLRLGCAWSGDAAGYRDAVPMPSGDIGSCEVAASWPWSRLPALSFNGGVGYQDLDAVYGFGHRYWSAGGAWRMGRVVIDLSAYGSDRRARRFFGRDTAGDRLVLGVVVEFGGRD